MVIREAPEKLLRAVAAYAGDEIANDSSIIIAGGFLRAFYAGETPSDMDVYFESEEDMEDFEKHLEISGWKKNFTTDRADSFVDGSHVIQAIRMFFGPVERVLDEFDFTVTQCALYREKVYSCDTFFEDLAARVLVFTGSRLPLSSLKRAFKYHQRGYHICDENLVKIAENIAAAVNFEDEKSIAEHTEPMDPDGERSIRLID